jgi:hypothetical protein
VIRTAAAALVIVVCFSAAVLLTASHSGQEQDITGYWRLTDTEILGKPLLLKIERSGDGYTISNLSLGAQTYSTAEVFGQQISAFPDQDQGMVGPVQLRLSADKNSLSIVSDSGDPAVPPQYMFDFARPQEPEAQLAEELAAEMAAQEQPPQ